MPNPTTTSPPAARTLHEMISPGRLRVAPWGEAAAVTCDLGGVEAGEAEQP
jgi:hypothetical protein